MAFFNQNVEKLASAMLGRIIAIPNTNIAIMITETQVYSRGENISNWRYKVMSLMGAGDLWACPFPLRHINLCLLVAKDREEVGACVRLKEANKFISDESGWEPLTKEGDISRCLKLEVGERVVLRFIDATEVLYLVKLPNKGIEYIDSTEANRYIDNLLGEP